MILQQLTEAKYKGTGVAGKIYSLFDPVTEMSLPPQVNSEHRDPTKGEFYSYESPRRVQILRQKVLIQMQQLIDSVEREQGNADPRNSRFGWIDDNRTLGEVIEIYRRAYPVEVNIQINKV